jgi:hypothetical protein
MRHRTASMVLGALLLFGCGRDSAPPTCESLERAFVEAKETWADARSAARESDSLGGADVTDSERDEITQLLAQLEEHQGALFESECVTE